MENPSTRISEFHSHPPMQGFDTAPMDLRGNGSRPVIARIDFVEGKSQNDTLNTSVWMYLEYVGLLKGLRGFEGIEKTR